MRYRSKRVVRRRSRSRRRGRAGRRRVTRPIRVGYRF